MERGRRDREPEPGRTRVRAGVPGKKTRTECEMSARGGRRTTVRRAECAER